MWSKKKNYLRRFKLKLIFSAKALRQFFIVNSDIFIRTILLISALAFFTSMSARISDDILAVNTLLFQFFFIFSYFADGFAFAGESLTGKAKGAGDSVFLRKTVSHLFYWGWGASIFFSLLFAFGVKPLMWVMTDNEELINLAMEYKWWIILLPVASGAAFIWDGIYVGVTASTTMRNTMIVATIFIFLPSYYLTINSLGNHSLWLALTLFMMSRGFLLWYMAPKTIY